MKPWEHLPEDWKEALRILEESGDTRALAVLLLQAVPDGMGMTPIPTAAIFKLAELFMPKDLWCERVRLVPETIPADERGRAMRDENIVKDMLTQIESGGKIKDAAANAAGKFGVKERTAMTAWKRARALPFVNTIAAQARSKRGKRGKPAI
jgi:hypothetical protein